MNESPRPTPSTTVASPTIVTVKVTASPSTIPSGRRRPPVAPALSSAGSTGSTHGLSAVPAPARKAKTTSRFTLSGLTQHAGLRMNGVLHWGDAFDGGNLVRRRLPLVLHRQAPLRGGAGGLRARGRGHGHVAILRARPGGSAPARRHRRRAAGRQVRHERRARRDAQRRDDRARRRRRARVPLRDRARRQHVRRAPADPPRRHLRPPGGRAGAADARLLHRRRGDLRPRDAGPPDEPSSASRRPRRATCWRPSASPTTCARTSCSPSQLGIQGVPFFVFDRKLGVSGAQPPEVLVQALQQAWDEAVTLPA